MKGRTMALYFRPCWYPDQHAQDVFVFGKALIKLVNQKSDIGVLKSISYLYNHMKKTPQLPDTDLVDEMTFEPLTKKTWLQFTELFGERGACGNCWCMYYRLPKAEFIEGKQDDGNKNAMKDLVWAGEPTGLLGFYEGKAIAWCAFAPREDFMKMEKSRVHKRIDDKPVWSVTCFFIDKQFRRMGVSVALLKGLIAYAKKQKIKIIEAYPTIPTQPVLPDSFAWIGLYKSFEKAGFKIVDHTSKSRPMVRFYVS